MFRADEDDHMERSTGTLMCIGSAAGFGAMAVFGKLAYDEGTTVGTLLVRPLRARGAPVLGARDRGRRGGAGPARAHPAGPAHGARPRAFGYAAQAGCFFAALNRIDASLLSLLLYTYPSMVAVAAILLRRERADARRFTALRWRLGRPGPRAREREGGHARPGRRGARPGGRHGLHDLHPHEPGHRRRMSPMVLSALVCTGATVTLTAGHRPDRRPRPGAVTAAGWGWLLSLAVVSTVAAVSLFFAGLKRVGPYERGDPLDGRAGRHRDPGVPRLRRGARVRSSCSAACS